MNEPTRTQAEAALDALPKALEEVERLTNNLAIERASVAQWKRESNLWYVRWEEQVGIVVRWRRIFEKIGAMSCVMGTDSGHAGINALARAALKDYPTDRPRCVNTNSDGLRCELEADSPVVGGHLLHSNGDVHWVTRPGKLV